MKQAIQSALVIVGLLSVSSQALNVCHAQEQRSPQAGANASSSVQGRVVDASGRPVARAIVTLTSEGQESKSLSSDETGHFAFQTSHTGNFVIQAAANGASSKAVTLDQEGNAALAKPLVLTIEKMPQAEALSDPMSFSDGASFVVSGVTDWTAVGGHGSDATLRTSEDLARATSTLKTDTKGTVVTADRQKLEQRLALNPNGVEENRLLGEYYLQANLASQALPHLKLATAAQPDDATTERDLALTYRNLGQLPEALNHARRALQKAPTADNDELVGELQERLGDPLDAVQHLQRAAKVSSSEPPYFAWGSELLTHRAVWQAADVFERGSLMFPTSLRMRLGWGSALFGEARYAEAAQQLCKASDLNPDDKEPYLMLAKVDQASPTKLQCAQERLMRFRRLNPKNADASYSYAMTLMHWGTAAEHQQARALLLEAVELQPQHAAALLQLGILAMTERRYEQAVALLQRSIAADSTDPEAHFRLAAAYEHTGQAALAQQERNKHAELKRKSSEQVEAERRNIKQFTVKLDSKTASN